MAGIPLIPGAAVTSSTYTVYDSNSSSGNKNKTPVELLGSENSWTGIVSVSAQPTYKFLQSMNVTKSLVLNHGVNLEDSDVELKFALSGISNSSGRTLIDGSSASTLTEAGDWKISTFEMANNLRQISFTVRYTNSSGGLADKTIYYSDRGESFPTAVLSNTYIIKGKQCFEGTYDVQNKKGDFLDTSCASSSQKLTLFSGATQNTIQGNFYYLKIWTKGELVHDYVPCIKYNSSGVAESIGVYDLITYNYITRDNSEYNTLELNNNLESGSTDWAYRQGISEEGFLYDSFAVQVTNLNTDTLAGVGVGGDAVIDTAYNAVWNDMVDLIEVPEDTDLKFGKCYCFDGETYKESSKYLDDGFLGIHSDTSGMLLGYKGEDKKHLQAAIAGFALAYVDKEYPVGTPLTCGENGFLTELKKEDLPKNFHKLVGTFWKKEWSDWWGFERAKTENLVTLVDGRMWVKVR